MEKFKKELEELINKNSMENESNTPDFILAEYLTECLLTFNETQKKRNNWYVSENSEESCETEDKPTLETLISKIITIGVPLPNYDYVIGNFVSEIPTNLHSEDGKYLHPTFREACERIINWALKEGFINGN